MHISIVSFCTSGGFKVPDDRFGVCLYVKTWKQLHAASIINYVNDISEAEDTVTICPGQETTRLEEAADTHCVLWGFEACLCRPKVRRHHNIVAAHSGVAACDYYQRVEAVSVTEQRLENWMQIVPFAVGPTQQPHFITCSGYWLFFFCLFFSSHYLFLARNLKKNTVKNILLTKSVLYSSHVENGFLSLFFFI